MRVINPLSQREPPITQLIHAVADGEQDALNELMPLVYAELKQIASRQLRRGAGRRGLQTTALVHELYERLVAGADVKAVSRQHFYALCAKAMRHHLVDRSRRRSAQKRGGGEEPFALRESDFAEPGDEAALVKLGEVLDRLEKDDPRAVRAFEMVHLIGESMESAAVALEASVRTIQRDVARVRAWFLYELEYGDEPT